ncbi:pyridoxamine 5-phosphate oxidase [Nocardia otitidiscaviarum]|uniref:Pyridoxamine 5-phosphate oxidase n=1 Tax=Nocardia otitidiscaviarum TaxID=1823 RepID=A0A516NTD9_9NOCA|nr:pyridoxamine 5'-phosphate oxidase family protein [Nocardia otitidiscaviarum]MCP9621453.1 pyridoxamine 5'-phosphate oxidase family protein [Nocardia otitidiscaviarum]QDP82144.1 pyridoxamine 5-phosphate oxidase [Nocardia otitidiscaviarum]
MPRAFTEAERQEFLAGQHVAVLSVDANGGRPPASMPIWYNYIPGGNLQISTVPSTRKARLIRQAGAVTLVVHRALWPYQYIIVEGTVVDITTPSPIGIREAIAIRYLGDESGRDHVRRMGEFDSVLFTIRPDRWITADYASDP